LPIFPADAAGFFAEKTDKTSYCRVNLTSQRKIFVIHIHCIDFGRGTKRGWSEHGELDGEIHIQIDRWLRGGRERERDRLRDR
jgi:hypothetical protein